MKDPVNNWLLKQNKQNKKQTGQTPCFPLPLLSCQELPGTEAKVAGGQDATPHLFLFHLTHGQISLLSPKCIWFFSFTNSGAYVSTKFQETETCPGLLIQMLLLF